MATLLCTTVDGGITLFTRTKRREPMSFPVVASLNGVQMFCRSSSDARLRSTTTEDSLVVWKIFHDRIVLILQAPQTDDDAGDAVAFFDRLLDVVFHSMVLLFGFDDLLAVENVERFRKEIKVLL